jgi:hypothetical protein
MMHVSPIDDTAFLGTYAGAITFKAFELLLADNLGRVSVFMPACSDRFALYFVFLFVMPKMTLADSKI